MAQVRHIEVYKILQAQKWLVIFKPSKSEDIATPGKYYITSTYQEKDVVKYVESGDFCIKKEYNKTESGDLLYEKE